MCNPPSRSLPACSAIIFQRVMAGLAARVVSSGSPIISVWELNDEKQWRFEILRVKRHMWETYLFHDPLRKRLYLDETCRSHGMQEYEEQTGDSFQGDQPQQWRAIQTFSYPLPPTLSVLVHISNSFTE
jgi:hypothetical protein